MFDDPTYYSYRFTSFDKSNLALNLKNYFMFPLNTKFSIQVKKSLGITYNFSLIYIYGACLTSLLILSLLPVSESKTDRFGYINNFYNESDDSLVSLHYDLGNREFLNYSFPIEILNFFPSFQTLESFVARFIPLNRKILTSFLKFWNFPFKEIYNFPILRNIFEFVFVGLVRFG